MQTGDSNLRELRILVSRRGALFRVCKVLFTRKDASIYLVPYAAGQRFFCGSSHLAEHEVSKSFRFTAGTPTDQMPKLSIHESGQVHVQATGSRIGVVRTPPMSTLRGQHIATVCLDEFNGLSPFTGTPRDSGAERDFVFLVGDDVASGRLAFYVNGLYPAFTCGSCLLTFTLKRSTLPAPLFVGLQPISQEKLGEPNRSGVTVIGGWNPLATNSDTLEFIYLRAE